MAPSPPQALCFTNVDTIGGSIQITKVGNPTPAKVFLYSTDGDKWNEYQDNQVIATAPGDKVYFKSDDDSAFSEGFYKYRKFVLSGLHSCTGSIDSIAPMVPKGCTLMFYGCTGLTQAPELPATTLADACYDSMFSGCTGLTQAPELPATTLADACYESMFDGCTGLTQAPELPATTLATRCYDSMFSGCTGLTQAPELPATTLADACYSSMFYGCSGLTQAPELPATTLADACYESMFSGCTNLNLIRCNAPTLEDFSDDWLYGVSGTGIFYKNPAYTPTERGASTIPEGWEVRDWV